ncbi:uncharacterized protein LOC128248897 [Octopus bimaculoides]|uniref:uncharacterized protein LOC128248897 n=1 Tax=Octopus bimaculoides TaxID=37653 RepID=UPI0022E6C3C6|nr:uncharacterized protein LOC128248897 [Octopus bimaculoides]
MFAEVSELRLNYSTCIYVNYIAVICYVFRSQPGGNEPFQEENSCGALQELLFIFANQASISSALLLPEKFPPRGYGRRHIHRGDKSRTRMKKNQSGAVDERLDSA